MVEKSEKFRKPTAGQQVEFVILHPGEGDNPDTASIHTAFVETYHDDTDDHLIDLTWFTRDTRGASFASTVPYDPTGQKDHSWSYRGSEK